MTTWLTNMHRFCCALTAAALVTGLSGCATVSEDELKDVLKEAKYSYGEFLIGPEDVLEVRVWRNQDLTKEVVVRPDGMISMPLIGDVRASGRTANMLAQEIQERLKQFKESPMVSVHVRQVNSYSVYVIGEVAGPGKYQLKSYATVLQVIALAGGFTQYASRNKIQVVRNGVNGDGERREIHIPVRYDDLLDGTGEPGNFILKSGDIVVVP